MWFFMSCFTHYRARRHIIHYILHKNRRRGTIIYCVVPLPHPFSDVKHNYKYITKTYAILRKKFRTFIRQITPRKIVI